MSFDIDISIARKDVIFDDRILVSFILTFTFVLSSCEFCYYYNDHNFIIIIFHFLSFKFYSFFRFFILLILSFIIFTGPSYGPFKARDYVSVVNFKKFNNGTFMITNRPAYHPDFPPSSKYVRATLLLVGNIIEPILGKENQQHTRLTQVAHINPGGAADTSAAAFVINKLCAVGPPSFIKKLENAAQKSDRMKKKTNEKKFKMPSIANDINTLRNKWNDMNIPDKIDKKISEKKKSIMAAFANSRTPFQK